MFNSIVLGILQGITEFLPISSSAHLIIYSTLTNDELPLVLNLAFHGGTTLAVLIYFRHDWWQIWQQEIRHRTGSRLLPILIVASVPATLAGLIGQRWIAEQLHQLAVTVIPLAGGAIVLWFSDRHPVTTTINQLNYRQALVIGLWQASALIPGMSRSGMAICGARLVGLSRQESVKLAFLLGTPLMIGALLLNLGDLIDHLHEIRFLFGVLVSSVSGFLVVKFFLRYIASLGFTPFVIYRLALAVIVAGYLMNYHLPN